MINPSIYIGFTLISEEADGRQRVSTFDGLSYQGLDDLQATVIQDILVQDFAVEFDALKQKMRQRLVEIGYATAVAISGNDPAEVEKTRGMLKKDKTTGKPV